MVLLCTTLYCCVLHGTVVYWLVLLCTAWYCCVLYGTFVYCIVLYCSAWNCCVLHDTLVYWIVMLCTAFYYIILNNTALYCTLLSFDVMYCTGLSKKPFHAVNPPHQVFKIFLRCGYNSNKISASSPEQGPRRWSVRRTVSGRLQIILLLKRIKFQPQQLHI